MSVEEKEEAIVDYIDELTPESEAVGDTSCAAPLGSPEKDIEDFDEPDAMVEDATSQEGIDSRVAEHDRASNTEENLSGAGDETDFVESHELSGVATAAAANTNQSTGNSGQQESDTSVYHVKWIQFQNKQVPVVTQNENGPCPLIAIANVLLLRQVIRLPANSELVTSQQIIEYFANYLLSADIKSLNNEERASFQQNMDDAFTLFPKLQTGLDMNLRFSGSRDFEYTPELGIFDLFEIPIYHGWLVDPQEQEVAETIRNCSYNQVVEKIINDKMSETTEVVRKALLAEEFLEHTASQLTYYGLCELNSSIKEGQLAVFFRNNHFNTLYMQKSSLYLLVTDQGFLQESQVVWETLNDVEGDSHFTDSNFRVYQKPEVSNELPSVNPTFVNTPEQLDSDYQLALSLANENANDESVGPVSMESDLALARRLQEEEDKQAAHLADGNEAFPSSPQARPVPRSASQPGHSAGFHGGQSARPQPVQHQSRRRESGESCRIL